MKADGKTCLGVWLLLVSTGIACREDHPSAARRFPGQRRRDATAARRGLSPPPDVTGVRSAKIDALFAARASGRSPGCAVGVYRAGEIVFARGYGYADLEHDVPLTEASVFYLASVSKQFTAAAVLLLAGDGKLSIDDDVRKFLPELPDYGKRVTLRHLLHHTSGVRDYELLLELEGRETDRLTNADMLWLSSMP